MLGQLLGIINLTLGVLNLNKTTLSTPCIDSGVWMLDGIVSCDYIEKPSGYGIHNNPAAFCQKYHRQCCITCTRLKQNGYTIAENKATSPVTTVKSSSTVTPGSCTDSGVWILDGIVSCDYLEKPSGYGIHNNPAGFCQQHHKECCKTCNKLKQNGYTTKTNGDIAAGTTSKTQKTSTLEITTRPPCTDSGVWILDGIVSCDYLEKPSGYGIHNNPAGFCQQHHKECCKTCNKLKQNGYTTATNGDTTLRSTTKQQVISKSTDASCTDSGVWIADSIVSCNYLEQPSGYGIHRNPIKFCNAHYKECCLTCTRLKQNGSTTTPTDISPKATTKSTTGNVDTTTKNPSTTKQQLYSTTKQHGTTLDSVTTNIPNLKTTKKQNVFDDHIINVHNLNGNRLKNAKIRLSSKKCLFC